MKFLYFFFPSWSRIRIRNPVFLSYIIESFTGIHSFTALDYLGETALLTGIELFQMLPVSHGFALMSYDYFFYSRLRY
jgi:hypothetical protein